MDIFIGKYCVDVNKTRLVVFEEDKSSSNRVYKSYQYKITSYTWVETFLVFKRTY